MSTTQIGHSFTVSSVTVEKDFDTRWNIQKRREYVAFIGTTHNDNVTLSYVSSIPVSVNDNVGLSDRSRELSANRIPNDVPILSFTGINQTVNTTRFKLTNIYTPITALHPLVPLFYKHELINPPGIGFTLNKITILDKNFKEINILTDLKVDQYTVYNNLEHIYNFSTGEYNVYYVSYSIRDNASGSVSNYVEILNNKSVYRLADAGDINPDTGYFYTDRQVYGIEELPSGSFLVTLPTASNYSLQETPNSKIQVLLPEEEVVTFPWYPKITNGIIVTNLEDYLNPGVFLTYKYNVPEFTAQVFDPYFPFKKRENELATWVSQNLIKIVKTPMSLDASLFVTVRVRDPEGVARLAFSNDPILINTTFEDDVKYEAIRSVDYKNGFIDVTTNLLISDSIYVDYYHEETEVEILDIDLNPILNRSILAHKLIFYLVPNNDGSRTKTIYILELDQENKIVTTNQIDNATLSADISFGLQYDGVPGFDFISKYTVNIEDGWNSNINNYKYLVLGEIVVSEHRKPKSAALFDVRVPGGGLKDDLELIEELARTVTPEVLWATHLVPWNGFPYPGSAAYLIEIPSSIQEDNGGLFNDTSIRQIVERHTGLGIYPIIRSYGGPDIAPELTPFDTSIEISWRSFTPDNIYQWNIYYATSEIGPFIKANNSPVLDTNPENLYTLTGLTSDTQYWIYIIPVITEVVNGVNIYHEVPDAVVGVNPEITNPRYRKVTVRTTIP